MPLPYHLIDGYNLLHAAGLARATYGPGDLERVRFGLLVRIADGLPDAERERTTVVFDAADPPPGADRRMRFRELTVVFAIETGDADAMIEDLIRRHASPRQLRVVSDDRRLQLAAKRRGAQAVAGEAFLRRLTRRAVEPSARDENVREPAGDPGDWAAYFGLSGGELAKPIEKAAPPREPSAPTRRTPTSSADAAKVPRPSNVAAGGTPSRAKRDPDPVDAEPEPPVEDLAFWQRRIDELLKGEGGGTPG